MTNTFLRLRSPPHDPPPACACQAFLVAGLFEESVKYLAVRRIVFKPYVVDPRALVVYSCAAGASRTPFPPSFQGLYRVDPALL